MWWKTQTDLQDISLSYVSPYPYYCLFPSPWIDLYPYLFLFPSPRDGVGCATQFSLYVPGPGREGGAAKPNSSKELLQERLVPFIAVWRGGDVKVVLGWEELGCSPSCWTIPLKIYLLLLVKTSREVGKEESCGIQYLETQSGWVSSSFPQGAETGTGKACFTTKIAPQLATNFSSTKYKINIIHAFT